jgi:phosphotriesterase-related protein
MHLPPKSFLSLLPAVVAFTAFLALRLTSVEPVIMTVTGPVSPDSIQRVLSHEHVLVDFIGAAEIGPHRYDIEVAFHTIKPHLDQARSRDVDLLIECTPAYLGRDPALLRRLSEATGLRLLTNTGLYGARNNLFLPAYALTESAEELAARWITEWTDGIEGTGIRPGFIKTAVDASPELSPEHHKLVAAAALTHRATGLTIAVHTGRGPGLAQLDILREHGVAPAAWIWVHAQSALDPDLIAAANAGAWLSFDGLRPDSATQHLNLLKRFRARGQLDRVLISHDAGWYDPAKLAGGEFRNYEFLFTDFLPLLTAAGFTAKEIDQLLRDNPRRAFTVQPRLLPKSAEARPKIESPGQGAPPTR